jgi:hypothetical protein
MIRPKAVRLRLDPLSYGVCAGRYWIATAGGVSPVARCQVWMCITGNFVAILELTQRET